MLISDVRLSQLGFRPNAAALIAPIRKPAATSLQIEPTPAQIEKTVTNKRELNKPALRC